MAGSFQIKAVIFSDVRKEATHTEILCFSGLKKYKLESIRIQKLDQTNSQNLYIGLVLVRSVTVADSPFQRTRRRQMQVLPWHGSCHMKYCIEHRRKIKPGKSIDN